MKKIVLIFLILLCWHDSISQELMVNAGWSISNHADLQRYQQQYIYETGLPLKAVQSYPSYFQYSLVARFPLGQRFQLGGTVFTTSSAARSVYEDYSGIWQMDYSLRCLGFGVTGIYSLNKPAPSVSLNLYAILGWNITSLKTYEYASLTSGVPFRNHTEQYRAASPSSEIGLECQYFFAGNFFIRGSAGFHLTSSATLVNGGSGDDYAAVNWSGARALLGIGYRLVKRGN